MTIYFHGLPGWLQLQQHFTGENKINGGVRKKKNNHNRRQAHTFFLALTSIYFDY